MDTRAIRRAAARLRALAADLDAAADGNWPDALALRDAPLLDAWELSARPAACLTGIRYGHPVLGGDGEPTVTSHLHLLDARAGTARTLSRWYRLGHPLDGGRPVA